MLLRTGTRHQGVLELAQQWLAEAGGLKGLSRLPASAILQKKGIGKAKAAALMAALELSRRLVAEELRGGAFLDSPEAVYRFLAPAYLRERTEIFGILTLDVRHRLIREHVLHRGVRDGASVEPAEVFHRAILDNAHGLILWHTHPSGDPRPSSDDLALTRTLVQAGQVLRVAVLDHVIVAAGGFVSLRQEQLMP
ncbi:MAG: DNA repair protein RadC [Thermoanaerobaculum sp.]|nr:DNA repair protein RadC [Thermoanaerobaculum sp.]